MSPCQRGGGALQRSKLPKATHSGDCVPLCPLGNFAASTGPLASGASALFGSNCETCLSVISYGVARSDPASQSSRRIAVAVVVVGWPLVCVPSAAPSLDLTPLDKPGQRPMAAAWPPAMSISLLQARPALMQPRGSSHDACSRRTACIAGRESEGFRLVRPQPRLFSLASLLWRGQCGTGGAGWCGCAGGCMTEIRTISLLELINLAHSLWALAWEFPSNQSCRGQDRCRHRGAPACDWPRG